MATKTKPLSRLRDKSKGAIHHMEIHPATNSKGGRAFLTKTIRHPPKGKTGPGMGYYGPPADPEETVHEDGQDMVDHVGRTFGVQPDDDGDEDD